MFYVLYIEISVIRSCRTMVLLRLGKKILKRGDVNKFANLTPYILGYDFV